MIEKMLENLKLNLSYLNIYSVFIKRMLSHIERKASELYFIT